MSTVIYTDHIPLQTVHTFIHSSIFHWVSTEHQRVYIIQRKMTKRHINSACVNGVFTVLLWRGDLEEEREIGFKNATWRYAKCYGRWRHFPDAASGRELPANAGDIRDMGSIPELGRSPGGGHGNPLQYFCLENPTDRGAWLATDHRAAKSWTWLKWLSTHGRWM